MTSKLTLVLAAVATALAAATAAFAAGPAGIRYDFAGKLTATPGSGATAVSITVQGGNRAALQKLLGASAEQTFSVGEKTEYLKWSNGVPTVAAIGDLAEGDVVLIHIRAPRDAELAQIEQTAAGLVGDHGPDPTRPDKPVFSFRGTLAETPGSGSLSVHVVGGDRRAMRLLIGHDADQTFAFDSSTIFLRWSGRVPQVVSAGDLKAGDRIAVHVLAAAGSTLEQVESTPAVRVGEREPLTTATS